MRFQLDRPNLTLALIAMLVGLVLALQFKGPRAAPPAGYSPGDPRDRAVRTIEQLEAEQTSLKSQIARLRSDLAEWQAQAPADTERIQQLSRDLEAQQIAAGLLPLRGPGVAVTLDDSKARNLPAQADINLYLVHDYDLRDVINVLWVAGAEAITVGDERIVSNTSIYCVGSTIMVNTTRLSPPYVVRAIGEPAVLADTLRNPSYLTSLRQKVERYGIVFKAAPASKMTLPAYTGGFSIKHLQSVSK